jgi:hypothetical protein
MSITIHYCDTTLDEFLQAVSTLGGDLIEIESGTDGKRYHLTWRDPEEPNILYGVGVWHRKNGTVSIDKGCVDCFNGQSLLDKHLKAVHEIESTYWD